METKMYRLSEKPRVRPAQICPWPLTLASSGAQCCEQVTCLMSCSWSKTLRPPRWAVPKGVRHELDYSLYPDVSSHLLYFTCQVKMFFLLKRRKRRKIKISPRCTVSPLQHWLLTHHFRTFSLLLGNPVTSPSLYLHLAFSVFPFSFGCIHFIVICLSLKSPSLFTPLSLLILSFYLSSNNGGVKWGVILTGTRHKHIHQSLNNSSSDDLRHTTSLLWTRLCKYLNITILWNAFPQREGSPFNMLFPHHEAGRVNTWGARWLPHPHICSFSPTSTGSLRCVFCI